MPSNYYCDSKGSTSSEDFCRPLFNPNLAMQQITNFDSHNNFTKKAIKHEDTLTRKFALLPSTNSRETYSKLSRYFGMLQNYKNFCSRALTEHFKSDPTNHLNDFNYDYQLASQTVYRDKLHLNIPPKDRKTVPHFFDLKDRSRLMGFYDSFIAVKNLIIRTENLRIIIDILINELKTNPAFTLKFLSGNPLRYDDLKPFISNKLLANDCFGGENDFTVEHLTNHIYQLRNLFLANSDFTYTSLRNSNLRIQNIFLSELQSFAIESVNFDLDATIKDYYRAVKRVSTSIATRLYSFRKKLKKLKNKTTSTNKRVRQRVMRLANGIKRLEIFLPRFLGTDISFITVSEFKEKCNVYLNCLKSTFIYNVTESTIKRVFEFEFLKPQNPDTYVLRRVFKPYVSRKIRSVSLDSFEAYIIANLRYSLLETFRTQLVRSSDLVSLVISDLKRINSTLYSEMTPPTHTTFSIRLIDTPKTIRSPLFPIDKKIERIPFNSNTALALEDRDLFLFKLSFIEYNFLELSIRDDYSRLRSLLSNGFTPAAPTITFRNRKLILHLPLTKKKEELTHTVNKTVKKVLSVDLGLIHFGVLSLWDKIKGKEFARYFLDATTLFDKKFDPLIGKFEYLQITLGKKSVSKQTVPSNIKQRIINIRAEIRASQRKKKLYEQRLLQRGITKFRTKRKWNELRRKISVLWDRIHNINEQIVHNLAHAIVEIAAYFKVDEIRVENLRWSHHSKKRKKGRFLAFWQTHWFFSQIQKAINGLCVSRGLPVTKTIPAAYSSQRCSSCGAINEQGKPKVVIRNPVINGQKKRGYILCKKCGFTLNADLNAARNLNQYPWKKPTASTNILRANTHYNSCKFNKKTDEFTCSRSS